MSDPNPPVPGRVPVAVAPVTPARYESPGTRPAVIRPIPDIPAEGHDNPGRIIATASYPGEDAGPVSGVVAETGFSATPQVPAQVGVVDVPGMITDQLPTKGSR